MAIQSTALQHLDRQLWVVTKAYGDNYYDIQKGSTLVLDYSFATGLLDTEGDYKNDSPQKHIRVWNATGIKLEAGDTCRISLRGHDNSQKPFISSAVRMPFGQYTGTGSRINAGIWDQTWANFRHAAAGPRTSAAANTWPGTEVFAYDIGVGLVGDFWPSALLVRKTGQLILVHRMGVGGLTDQIRVKILDPHPTLLRIKKEYFINLTHPNDKRLGEFIQDATAFYDYDNDLLHVLRLPGDYGTIGDQTGRIWTIRLTDHVVKMSTLKGGDFDVPLNGVNIAGNRLIIGNLSLPEIAGYKLNLSTLKWTQEWRKNTATLATTYGTGGGPSRFNISNYSPPWYNSSWYVCTSKATRNETNTRNIRADIYELALKHSDGKPTPVALWTHEDYSLSEIENLSAVNTAYGDYRRLWADIDDVTETRYAWYLEGVGQNPYTYTTRRQWLGAQFSDFRFSMDIWAGFSGGSKFENTTTLYTLSSNYGTRIGIPKPPPAMPMRWPNQGDLTYRFFWDGRGRGDLSQTTDTNNTRGCVTSDGWRYWASIRPRKGCFTPTLPGASISTERVTSILRSPTCYVGSSPCGPGTGFECGPNSEGGMTYWLAQKDSYTYGAYFPAITFNYETVLFAVSPENAVTELVLSSTFAGGKWPHPNGTDTIEITQELSIPDNVWQVVELEGLNKIAVILDTRDAVDADPIPAIWIYEKDLTLAYKLDPGTFFDGDVLTKYETDQTYEGNVWARKGQYSWTFHGLDSRNPPQAKAWLTPEGEQILAFTFELIKRVEPSVDTEGETRNSRFVMKLGPYGIVDVVTAGTSSETWNYPNILTDSEATDGPKQLRSLAISEDKMYIAWGPEPKIRQM